MALFGVADLFCGINIIQDQENWFGRLELKSSPRKNA